jgi:hypothetical protein
MTTERIYRVNASEVATYGTAAPGVGETWTHVPQIGRPRPPVGVNFDDANVENSLGLSSTRYVANDGPFAYPIETQLFTGTKGEDGAGADTSPTAAYLHNLWLSLFGMAAVANPAPVGTTAGAASGPGKTTDLQTAASGTANWAVGDGIMCNGQVNFVEKVVDSTHATLMYDFSPTPSPGDVIYCGFNFSAVNGVRTKYEYLTVEESGHGWLYGPGQVMSGKIAGMAAGNGLRVQMGFEGNSIAAGVTPTTFTPNAFTGQPAIAKGGQCVINQTATAIAEASCDFGIIKNWLEDATAVNGRGGVEIAGQEATVTIVEPYLAQRVTDYRAGTTFPLMIAFTVGSTNAAKARGWVGLFIPNAQLDPTAEGLYSQNQLGLASTFKSHNPALSSDAIIAANCTKACYLSIGGGV